MTGRAIDQILPHPVDPQLYESYVQDARHYIQMAEKKSGQKIQRPVPLDYVWGDALEVWRQRTPDLKLINLETSLTTHSVPWPAKEVQYRMHPANVAVLTAAGFNFCSLANNHTLDWGREGLLETMETLQKAGIPFGGAGKDQAEAVKPTLLQTQKGRVIILACGLESSGIPKAWAATPAQPGLHLLPDLGSDTVETIAEQVIALKAPGDVVVFSVHWGSNWGYEIPPSHRRFAHDLIDVAGVDLVFGHSSHHPRGIEVFRQKLIVYGAGDFLNDYEGIGGHEQFRGDLSLMYFPDLDPATGQLVSLQMVPLQIKNFRLQHASAQDAAWLRDTLNRECEKFGAGVALQDKYLILTF